MVASSPWLLTFSRRTTCPAVQPLCTPRALNAYLLKNARYEFHVIVNMRALETLGLKVVSEISAASSKLLADGQKQRKRCCLPQWTVLSLFRSSRRSIRGHQRQSRKIHPQSEQGQQRMDLRESVNPQNTTLYESDCRMKSLHTTCSTYDLSLIHI
eukprot:TRINITY_DN927_c0_g1_i6.p1 TRINITY_DN927_c0_g1~~TRINITY_DN927_c0_g1_i6.p1  ORF type:complete len:156 (-),score=2.26 TRINITY_DN927_c0_g1_i6:60-527(-)